MTEKKICIAKILTAHGVRGLVKVDCFLEEPADLDNYNPLKTVEGKEIILHLKNPLKGKFLAEIEGVADRTEAEKYRNIELFIDRAELPEADDGFYHEDLAGMEVRDKDNVIIGKILAVENFGASDLLQIKLATGKSFYLPFTDTYVGEIKDGFVHVDRIEDFIE